MKPRLNQIELDIISHFCRLAELKKILRYAIYDGDLKKAQQAARDVAQCKAEIRRLRALAERLRADNQHQKAV